MKIVTEKILADIADELEKVVGPLIASWVINLFKKKAVLEFSDEQEAVLVANRLKALELRADDVRRSIDAV